MSQRKVKVFPHVEAVDLYDDGTAYEVAVVKRDQSNGDLYYIRIDYMDEIDRARLRKILSRPDAANYELWYLLDNETLRNGQNALELFNQLVKVKTTSGQHFPPGLGRSGARAPKKAAKTAKKEAKAE